MSRRAFVLAPRGDAHVRVLNVAHHRNGIAGVPFHAVAFEHQGHLFVGVVWGEPGGCAVLRADMAAQGVVDFFVNSWRGDLFEAGLRRAIEAWERNRREAAPVPAAQARP